MAHQYEGQLEDDFDDYYDDDPAYCGSCDEFGMYVTCVDDMCHSGSEDGIWDEPIDFATDSGFFVLLDALRAGDIQIAIQQTNNNDYFIALGKAKKCNGTSVNSNIKTALVAATLEFIEREQTK